MSAEVIGLQLIICLFIAGIIGLIIVSNSSNGEPNAEQEHAAVTAQAQGNREESELRTKIETLRWNFIKRCRELEDTVNNNDAKICGPIDVIVTQSETGKWIDNIRLEHIVRVTNSGGIVGSAIQRLAVEHEAKWESYSLWGSRENGNYFTRALSGQNSKDHVDISAGVLLGTATEEDFFKEIRVTTPYGWITLHTLDGKETIRQVPTATHIDAWVAAYYAALAAGKSVHIDRTEDVSRNLVDPEIGSTEI